MDLHHNIFYGYRGPDTGDADRDQQLENNLTKALINTLSIGGKAVWGSFLTWLGEKAGCNAIADAANSQFLLQRRDLPSIPAASKRYRVLLGISKREATWSHSAEADGKDETHPDAWIYGDGFAVLVESKVGESGFSAAQMEGHYSLLGAREHAPPEVALTTWRELHHVFCNLLPKLADTAQFLVRQFIQFLEYSEMSGFTGFRLDHFNYFLLGDDEDARRWVRDQVEDFAARVQAELCKVEPFYASYHVGTLRRSDSHCWAAFGPADGELRKVTRQSIDVSTAGLNMYMNTEGKPAVKRLKEVLKHSGDRFRAALQELHDFRPFELFLMERECVGPRQFKETPKMRLHSSMLADEAGSGAWTAFRETVQRLHLLYFEIRRILPPKELNGLSERQSVQLVVEVFQRNHAVVKLLNG